MLKNATNISSLKFLCEGRFLWQFPAGEGFNNQMKQNKKPVWLIENIAISIPIICIIIGGSIFGGAFQWAGYPFMVGMLFGVVVCGAIGVGFMNKLLEIAEKRGKP